MDELFRRPVPLSLGLPVFAETLAALELPVGRVEWQPPAGGDPELAALLARTWRSDVEAANAVALERLLAAQPVLVDVRPAIEVVPGMTGDTMLLSGPPIIWERMSGPMRGAVIGGLLLEGLARTPEEAERVATSGAVRFSPAHHHQAVGPLAGVTTASMPVLVVENRAFGNVAFCNLNEGPGKVLRFGAFSEEVIERLRWMIASLAPALAEAIRREGGVDIRSLIAQAIEMGDECHNRNRAASSLLLRVLGPHLAELELSSTERGRLLRFLAGNDYFFLSVAMAACKAALDAAHGIPHSSLVTVMARNGTDFGVRVSGLGDEWFTGPAQTPVGLFFSGYSAADANPDMGDSSITETGGLGGFALAGSLATVQFVGGTTDDAISYSQRMYEITLGESRAYRLPVLGFRGTPTGIDLRLVMQTGILPQIDTGIPHRLPGIGQIGAGLVTPPRECFEAALRAFAARC
ncbi:MAG: DUF1116 domain-containing protein [Chloroflexi bacterium]|nr:DUF1116 domain-containing protein [Chloroflexota bacterium]